MIDLKQYEVWFVTGSQDLYGEATLRKVAEGEARVEAAKRRTEEVLSHFTAEDNLAQWKRRIAEGIEASRRGRTALIVLKAKHRLDFYQDGRCIRSFPVELGSRPILPKVREGDRVSLLDLRNLFPGREVEARLRHDDGSSETLRLRHTLNGEQIAWFREGGALNGLRKRP